MLRLTISIACIFSGCMKSPPHVKATDVAMKKYTEQVSQTKNLKVLGCGGFFEQDHVRAFYADFESDQNMSKEDAKNLLTDLVQTCLEQLNHDGNLIQFVQKQSLDKGDVSISIGFVDKNRNPYPELSQIHLFENKVHYSTYDPKEQTYICTQTEVMDIAHEVPEDNHLDSPEDLELPEEVN